MNYAYEIVKKAHTQGIKTESLFFCQAKQYSPWYEQSFPCLNQKTIEDTTIEINGLFRYFRLFHRLLHQEIAVYPELRRYMFDLFIHFLCELDLHKDLTREDFYVYRLEYEMLEGIFGAEYARVLAGMQDWERKNAVKLVYRQMAMRVTLSGFRKAVRLFYPDALLYQMREKETQLLLYLGIRKTAKETEKVNFLIGLFLPLGFDLRIFWDKHFGVVGVGATMQPDSIEIF